MAQWTYSRNVQLINEICTVGFLNIDFVRCFVSLDVVRITSANGRAISINLHLHPDTLVHFCARAASLLNEEHAWDWIEMTLIEEIRSAEETHHCLNTWVHHLRCPPSRRDSFVWRLVTSASSVTVADLHHAYAQAVDPHQGMGISPIPSGKAICVKCSRKKERNSSIAKCGCNIHPTGHFCGRQYAAEVS